MKIKRIALACCIMLLLLPIGNTSAKYSGTSNTLSTVLSVTPYIYYDSVGGLTEYIIRSPFSDFNNLSYSKKGNKHIYSFTGGGVNGAYEKIAFPITGLTAGTTYSMNFDCFIGETRANSFYYYGCGVYSKEEATAVLNAFSISADAYKENNPTTVGSIQWKYNGGSISNTGDNMTPVTGPSGVTITFTATAPTMYWLWDVHDITNITSNKHQYVINSLTATTSKSVGFSSGDNSVAMVGSTYSIDTSGVSCITIPEIEMMGNSWPVGVDTMLTLKPYAGYQLPTTIYVTVGGNTYDISTTQNSLSNGTVNYAGGIEFDTATKELYIPASMINGTVSIVAIAQ